MNISLQSIGPSAVRSLHIGTRCRLAFTLIELTIVLLVVGILASVAIPKFGTALSSTRSFGAAKWIKSDLTYAQRLAQQTSTNQSVTFDTVAESYTLAGALDINRRGQAYTIELDDSKFNADLVSADFGGSSTVTFNIFGRPNNAGTIVVRSGSKTETIILDEHGHSAIP